MCESAEARDVLMQFLNKRFKGCGSQLDPMVFDYILDGVWEAATSTHYEEEVYELLHANVAELQDADVPVNIDSFLADMKRVKLKSTTMETTNVPMTISTTMPTITSTTSSAVDEEIERGKVDKSSTLAVKENTAPNANDEGVQEPCPLADLFPDLNVGWLRDVLRGCDGNLDTAAVKVMEALDSGVAVERRPASNHDGVATDGDGDSEDEDELRKGIVARYAVREEVVYTSLDKRYNRQPSNALRLPESTKPTQTKLRYRDDKIVTTKGEKYVFEVQEESEAMKNTVVKLTKISKGRRGPGSQRT